MANLYRAAVPNHIVTTISEDRFFRRTIAAAHEKERLETETALARKFVPYGQRNIDTQIDAFQAQIDAAVARQLLTLEQAAVREEQYYRGMLSSLGPGRERKQDRKLLRSLIKDAMRRY